MDLWQALRGQQKPTEAVSDPGRKAVMHSYPHSA